MSNELLEFIQEDLKDTDKLGNLNEKIEEHLQSIIDEFSDHIIPAIKQTIGIMTGLRANLKAIVSIHGESSPFTLGFQLGNLTTLVDNMGKHLCLCETVVIKLSRAKLELQQLLIFLNFHVLKIHYQMYEHARERDSSTNQDPNPPQITNMRSSLAKLDCNQPEL